jgi:hypothetical protein
MSKHMAAVATFTPAFANGYLCPQKTPEVPHLGMDVRMYAGSPHELCCMKKTVSIAKGMQGAQHTGVLWKRAVVTWGLPRHIAF